MIPHSERDPIPPATAKAVAFDWGGVLIENPAETIVAYCSRVLRVTPALFAEQFAEVEPAFQIGAMSEEEFWTIVCARLGVPTPTVRSLWGAALRHAYRPRPEMFAFAASLRRRRIPTALVSNTELPALDLYRERHEGAFDQVILSCLEGMRKPFPEIYRLTAERLGVLREEVLLIDDREENVEGARRAGLKAILFRSSAETIANVNALLD
jgi:putative hydrolase of the HAD superfamily